jgi:hypothetical protein
LIWGSQSVVVAEELWDEEEAPEPSVASAGVVQHSTRELLGEEVEERTAFVLREHGEVEAVERDVVMARVQEVVFLEKKWWWLV